MKANLKTIRVSGARRHLRSVLQVLFQGKSSKFAPHAQKVGLGHLVHDEDVVSSMSLNSVLDYSHTLFIPQYSPSSVLLG